MPRRRAAESLLPAEDGIEEVIVRHRRTKRGIRTTEKAVPILLPSKAKPAQSSHSKKGKKNDQLESDTAEGSQVILNSLGDTQSQQFIDEQMEGLPDDDMEQGQPQPTGIRAAEGSHGKENMHTRHKSSSSLRSVQEDLESLHISNQPPTPQDTPKPDGVTTAPIISDTLFDHPDIPLDSVDGFPDQTQREPSGNRVLTIVDRSGIFEMEAVFCVCSSVATTRPAVSQLRQSRLLPSCDPTGHSVN
ncbi:hypothetical protein EDB85DRAFT_1894332 [Lactarius pseudohatsudake]|nr:hypothetical protein EDB85DRAFT_1894332 [Lactarius pseudohatsudake]